jgi:hypothetical protein
MEGRHSGGEGKILPSEPARPSQFDGPSLSLLTEDNENKLLQDGASPARRADNKDAQVVPPGEGSNQHLEVSSMNDTQTLPPIQEVSEEEE